MADRFMELAETLVSLGINYPDDEDETTILDALRIASDAENSIPIINQHVLEAELAVVRGDLQHSESHREELRGFLASLEAENAALQSQVRFETSCRNQSEADCAALRAKVELGNRMADYLEGNRPMSVSEDDLRIELLAEWRKE